MSDEPLKSIYLKGNKNLSVTVISANGGSPPEVVKTAIKRINYYNYNQTYVLLDKDIFFGWPSSMKKDLRKVRILFSKPCIEGLFLNVLNHKNFDSVNWSTQKCKSVFHKNYLNERDKMLKYNYGKIFPYHLLEEKKLEINELNDIINIFLTK